MSSIVSIIPVSGEWFVSWRTENHHHMLRVAAWAQLESSEVVPLVAGDYGGLEPAHEMVGDWNYSLFEARQAYAYRIVRHNSDELEGPGCGDSEPVAFEADNHGRRLVLWRTVHSEAAE